MADQQKKERVLSIDIGGSHVKGTIVDETGTLLFDYKKIDTPSPANPAKMLEAIQKLVKDFPPYDYVSAGFPGYVREGIVKTAPNLGSDYWKDVNFSQILTKALGKPAIVVNDADMQGLGIAQGKGLEMVLTLGTGFGTALIYNGTLLPHLEIAHHPFAKKMTYDDYIGQRAMDAIGEKKWNKRLQKILLVLKTVFNYDYLYIGGGNSSKINFKLDKNVKAVSNIDGIHGGYKLWKQNV